MNYPINRGLCIVCNTLDTRKFGFSLCLEMVIMSLDRSLKVSNQSLKRSKFSSGAARKKIQE
jgi:hypothetical protein